MSDKPILKINIDAEEWEAFVQKYEAWQEKVKAQPEVVKINTATKDFGKKKGAFDSVVKAGENRKATGQNSFIARFSVESKESAKSWESIEKSIEKTTKNFLSLGRSAINFSGIGAALSRSFVTLGGGVAAAAAAVPAAASDIASKNREARALGLDIGAPEAFENDFARYGLGKADLARMADIKSDVTKQQPLISAGITPDQIASMNTEELTQEYAKRVSQLRRQWQQKGPQYAANQAEAWGVNNVFDQSQQRVLASYTPEDLDKSQSDYLVDAQKLKIQQEAADKASEALARFKDALEQDANQIEQAITPLMPLFASLAGDVSDSIAAFAKSDELKQGIEGVGASFKTLKQAGDWLADGFNKISSLWGIVPPAVKPNQKHDVVLKPGSAAAGIAQSYYDIKSVFTGKNDFPDLYKKGGNFDWAWRTQPASNVPASNGTTGGAAPVNNPGNLRPAGKTTGFQQFKSVDEGAWAAAKQLKLYYDRDKLDTIDKVISKWAPSSENNTSAYIADVQKRTGFKLGQHINLDDPQTLAMLSSAMFQHESKDYQYLDSQKMESLIASHTRMADRISSGAPQQSSQGTANKSLPANPIMVGVNLTVNSPWGFDTTVTSGSLVNGQ